MKISKFGKKGFLGGGMGVAISTILGLFLVSVLVYALAIAGANIKTTTTDNTSIGIIQNMSSGISQFGGFSSTFWIMAAIGLLLSVLLGSLFVYFNKN